MLTDNDSTVSYTTDVESDPRFKRGWKVAAAYFNLEFPCKPCELDEALASRMSFCNISEVRGIVDTYNFLYDAIKETNAWEKSE